MYAETGLLFPYYQNFSIEVQPFEEFWHSQKPSDLMEVQPFEEFWHSEKPTDLMASTILEYDLGAEGDLFKAPRPIIEEPMIGLDPITAAISMISCGEDVISTQALKVPDIESMQNEQLLSEVFYEFRNDLLANEATGTSLSEVLQIQIPTATDENPTAEEKVLPLGILPKSGSSECLSSKEWIHGNLMRPNFLDFPGMDFGAVYGLRRSLSEGDIKVILKDWAGSLTLSFYVRVLVMVVHLDSHKFWAIVPLKIAGKSFLDTGQRRQREILEGKSSMLAERLLQTVSQGSAGGLQRQKNLTFQKSATLNSDQEEER